MEAGADDELGAGVDGGSGLIGSDDGAGAEQELVSILFLESFKYVDRTGHCHGDFDDRDTAGHHGLDEGVSLAGVAGAKDWNQADAFKNLSSGFAHFSSFN
jgi:hypothetical protein